MHAFLKQSQRPPDPRLPTTDVYGVYRKELRRTPAAVAAVALIGPGPGAWLFASSEPGLAGRALWALCAWTLLLLVVGALFARSLGRFWAQLPLIAMTASATAYDRRACLDSGMDDFVSKPVQREALEAVLRRWLPQRALPSSASSAPSDTASA